MADSMMEYAQPLLDETDGSMDELNKALSIAQTCWNLALVSEEEREETLAVVRSDLKMDDDEFFDYRDNVVAPMILRHKEMFPNGPLSAAKRTPSRKPPRTSSRPPEKKYQGTGRNAPCPCESGKKYKKCCGK